MPPTGKPRIVPVTGRAALTWIAAHHRHLPRLQGALFAAGCAVGDDLVGVATAGNPPRVWQGTGRFVITRVAMLPGLPPVVAADGSVHAFPGCTMLYRALCDAGRALGYTEVWTYTLPHEDGRSLRAANFEYMGETERERPEGFSRPSRKRAPAVRPEVKGRWRRQL